MNILAIFTVLLSTAAAAALPRSPPANPFQGCLQPSEGFLNASQQMAGLALAQSDNVWWNMETIKVWFHVVGASDKVEDGMVSVEAIDQQFFALNKAFASADFRFELQGITKMVDADLASAHAGEDSIMKAGRMLRQGDWATLNIYIVKALDSPSFMGACTWAPWEAFDDKQRSPQDPTGDGCIIRWDTLAPNLTGMVAVHEIGHWLGLLHTFSETCDPADGGDFVHDTPRHLLAPAELWDDCDKHIVTCPDLPGNDPVRNHMNYMAEECRTEFTWGQANHMHLWWDARVKGLVKFDSE